MSNDRPRRRPGLEVEVRDEEAHVTDPTSEKTHVLNPSAYAIWELCDGETPIEIMAEAVAEVTALDSSDAENEVRQTVDLLMEKGLVE